MDRAVSQGRLKKAKNKARRWRRRRQEGRPQAWQRKGGGREGHAEASKKADVKKQTNKPSNTQGTCIRILRLDKGGREGG